MTLVHHEWHLKPGAESYFNGWSRCCHPESKFDHTTTAHIIPDGTWIMERPSLGWSQLVGVEHSAPIDLHITDESGLDHIYLICDKPFGFVVDEYNEVRKTLVCARQVHKGELGRTVPIPRLAYVRQTTHKPYAGMKARDRRRGNLGWVRFADFMEAACVNYELARAVQLVLDYWQFSGHLFYADGIYEPTDTLVDVAFALYADEIKGSQLKVVEASRKAFQKFALEEPDTVWIRRGFAYTILRLLALGYKPVEQPA